MRVFLFCCFSFLTALNADDVIKIEVGKNYQNYSNSELRRRVWELERAVFQLQMRVFQLEGKQHGSAHYTCTLQSFGKTHVANGETRASALAQVLKKCSDETSSVHCKESDAKCSNE